MKKAKPEREMRRACDVATRYYAVCGLLFLLGIADLLFMIVICFMAKRSGSTQMLILLDAFEALPVIGLLLCYLQTAAVCKRKMNRVCAAAERRGDGTVRLEYRVGRNRFFLELGKENRTEASGMIPVWYDERNPRNVFFGSKPPLRVSLYGVVNLGVILLACAAVNAIFFLFLR